MFGFLSTIPPVIGDPGPDESSELATEAENASTDPAAVAARLSNWPTYSSGLEANSHNMDSLYALQDAQKSHARDLALAALSKAVNPNG